MANRALARIDAVEGGFGRLGVELEQRALRDDGTDRALDLALVEILSLHGLCVEHQASALVNAALDDRARYLQHSLKQLDTGQVVRHPLAPEKEEGVIHVLGQVDGSQQLVLALDDAVDGLDSALPSSGWSSVIDPAPQLRHALVEESAGIIDIAQRATSPDFAGDLAADAWDAVFG